MVGVRFLVSAKIMVMSVLFIFTSQVWGAEFSVATWNIQKGGTSGWAELLHVHQPDIALIQEVTTDPLQVLSPLETALGESYRWLLNPAWIMSDGYATGTLNMSHYEVTNHELLLSQDVEPFAATPKSMIMTDYLIPMCGEVRVINLHMLNFNLGSAYGRQLEQLSDAIKNHQGPLVVAGDFNSWNIFRENTLFWWAEGLGLSHVETARHTWVFVLDHIFYKNLTLKEAEEVPTSLSDHHLLKAKFNCP